jgi:hypothetical protein
MKKKKDITVKLNEAIDSGFLSKEKADDLADLKLWENYKS